jgi:hypothetical protein
MIRPNRVMARVTGIRPLALFDDNRARAVYPMAYEQGLRYGELLSRRVPEPRAETEAEAGPAA